MSDNQKLFHLAVRTPFLDDSHHLLKRTCPRFFFTRQQERAEFDTIPVWLIIFFQNPHFLTPFGGFCPQSLPVAAEGNFLANGRPDILSMPLKTVHGICILPAGFLLCS